METKIKAYEGMFLLDSGNPDFQAASEPVRAVLTRYGAEILAVKLWDDRKLVYEIGGRKRGLYVLTYFKADPLRIVEIEHDCQLDERILRVLVLHRDSLTEKEINAETPATFGSHRPPEAAPGEPAPGAPGPGAPAEAAPEAAEVEEAPEVEAVPVEEQKS
jgi:small subunit ribosomal protein S6